MDLLEAKGYCVSRLFGPSVQPRASRPYTASAVRISVEKANLVASNSFINGVGLLADNELGLFLERNHPAGETVARDLKERTGTSVRPMVVGRFSVNPPGSRSQSAPRHLRSGRPVPGGVSIGHFQVTAGTLGCRVRGSDGNCYILSNNHVLANSNRATRGDPVYQPGPYDGGTATDQIASLSAWEPLLPSSTNLVDSALAGPVSTSTVDDSILGIGKLVGVAPPASDIEVRKSGRTTAVTTGKVTAIDSFVQVDYGALGTLSFDGQMLVRSVGSSPFSAGGDSGSVIVDPSNRGIGLLFAGSDLATLANPLSAVASKLKIASFG